MRSDALREVLKAIDAEPLSTGAMAFLYFRDHSTVERAREILTDREQFEPAPSMIFIRP